MLFKKKFLSVFILVTLQMACTFEPLYSEKILSEYHIIEPNKSNKDLHQVYSSLKRLIFLNNEDENLYTVELDIQKRFDDIDIREDEKVTRMGISTIVFFKIRKKNSDIILFTGKSIGSNAFNRLEEPYSNEIAKNDSVSKLATTIALDIRNQLALFSKKLKN